MLMERAAQFWSLAAPQGDGQTLIDPPFDALLEVVAANRQHLAAIDYDMQGQPLTELAAAARRNLVSQALAYTRRYRDVPRDLPRLDDPAGAPVVLSGHQPQLYHPGVWYKNFVLGRLARSVRGIGIHFLIDSDLCRSASIRVPTGTATEPRVESVPYDAPSAEVPYEERIIRDPATLASFSNRVGELLHPLVKKPLVEQLWPLVMERSAGEENLGLRLAQGRHALEETWRNDTLELPQSAVCRLPEFSWFAAHLLANLPRFWSAHNDSLAAYRHAHALRNRAQPVPDLDEVDGWLEAPLWLWTADDPVRRPLYARQHGDQLLISDRHRQTVLLPLSDDGDPSAFVELLTGLAARGIKIRTRALATTLFARLVLGDLFLHGIGGAKYDQVTDEIIRRFFGFTPPEFATVSATLRLPIERLGLDGSHDHDWQQRLRELQFHPERHLTIDGELDALQSDGRKLVSQLINDKRRWVATAKTPENAAQRHAAINAANEALQPFVAGERRQLERQLDDFQHRQRVRRILDSREYSFCLFPRAHFERLLLDGNANRP